MARRKKQAWFIRIRGSYLPCSKQGWLSYVPFVAYLLLAVIIAGYAAQSLALSLYMVIPQWVAAAVVMSWIADKKS